jgi:hypothetical protein
LTFTDLLDLAFFFAAKAGAVPIAATPKHKQVSSNRVNLFM